MDKKISIIILQILATAMYLRIGPIIPGIEYLPVRAFVEEFLKITPLLLLFLYGKKISIEHYFVSVLCFVVIELTLYSIPALLFYDVSGLVDILIHRVPAIIIHWVLFLFAIFYVRRTSRIYILPFLLILLALIHTSLNASLIFFL